jgi:hypothetical protein
MQMVVILKKRQQPMAHHHLAYEINGYLKAGLLGLMPCK